jgi:hypothetical protein
MALPNLEQREYLAEKAGRVLLEKMREGIVEHFRIGSPSGRRHEEIRI